ncbi:hypothetical protein [Salmonella enterica]|uniref:hypothetical protein n=1 Tax=Salmonella enterica TaxID=28901 RepID=UPI001C1E9360|nr:hypothetical protein [Salmonella enterica]
MQRYPSDASGDYRYLICIFIAESMENMVHPGGLLALRLPPPAVLTQRYPSWCLR